MSQEWIYTLQLQGSRYYVGRTNNMTRRWQEHQSGKGSSWTRAHKPLKIVAQQEKVHKYQELTTTLSLMAEKGIDKVRGDIFTTQHLDETQLLYIKMLIASEDSLCYHCLQPGHFAAYCPNHDGSLPVGEANVSSKSRKCHCQRCGRSSHSTTSCYASTDVNGKSLTDKVRPGKHTNTDIIDHTSNKTKSVNSKSSGDSSKAKGVNSKSTGGSSATAGRGCTIM